VTPNQVLAGANRLFVRSLDNAGLDTGYQQPGGASFTVTGNRAPTNGTVSPLTGTTAAGAYRTITATYSDPDGAHNLNAVYLSLNRADASRRLEAVYIAETNRLYLINELGNLVGGFAPGSGNTITTGRGSLNCATTTVSRVGNTLTVNWSIAGTSALAGSNTISLRARDRGGLDTLYQLQPGAEWVIV